MIRTVFFVGLFLTGLDVQGQGGPYHPDPGQAGSHAVHRDSVLISGWATQCSVIQGPENISNAVAPLASFGSEASALGMADGDIVSLGDGGEALFTLSQPLQDGPGPDFAIFENGFFSPADDGYFLELAHVEVSSNGVDFVRFPSASLTPVATQVGSFGVLDPTQLNNLAGKYPLYYGVPFDLLELDTVVGLDIQAITHIRIIDAVGSVDAAYGTQDASGQWVNDPWPTEFASSGFDLDALAFLDRAAVGVSERTAVRLRLWPNPTEHTLRLDRTYTDPVEVQVTTLDGRQQDAFYWSSSQYALDVSDWPAGMYFVSFVHAGKVVRHTFIKTGM